MKNRIKQIRKDNGLTQVAFGERIGVKGNTITNYENGMRIPTDAVILSICREFGINEDWIRHGKEPKKKETSTEYEEIATLIGERDPKAKQAIIDYWKLSPEDKELFWNFINRFIKGGD